MNNRIKIAFLALIFCGLVGFQSCEKMLDVNSNGYLNTDDNKLNSPNDSLYSVSGILNLLQPLGEKYFVLGELRGDLMAVTDNADMNLQAIANFTATADNPYLSTKEYYAVINNCNYFLQHVDTSIISGGRKVMRGEYSVVKAIRAWTYMQLVLNYGKAVYLTEPILNIDDMNKDYPVMEPQQLMETLLDDISNYIDYTNYPTYFSSQLFISGPMVAGDLLLWLGAYTGDTGYYERAANIYYRYIVDNHLRGAGMLRNMYQNSDFNSIDAGWYQVLSTTGTGGYNEGITWITYSTNSQEVLNYPLIFLLTFSNQAVTYFKYEVKPSQAAIDLWNNETYVYYNSSTKALLYTKGDLRGNCMVSTIPCGSYYYEGEGDSLPTIAKYGYFFSSANMYNVNSTPLISLYRTGILYLRYAEALNGLGKPSLAFAVLKYGLKSQVLADSTKVNPSEITPLPAYCDFNDPVFSDLGIYGQLGIHSRGSGNVEQDTTYYAFTEETLRDNSDYYGIPATLETHQDSINFVNVMICKELGLESAFEGNRFQDLMRFSIRNGDDDFLAKWVGRRNPALTSTLMNRNNWYLPTPQ